MQDAAEAVFRGKFIVLNTEKEKYIKNQQPKVLPQQSRKEGVNQKQDI